MRATAASEDCNGHTCSSTSTNARSGGDRSNDSRSTGHEYDHDSNDGSNNRDDEPRQTPSTTPPPTPTAGDEKPSVRSPKRVLTVGDKLSAEPLLSSTDTSALWTSANGSIMFAKQNDKSSDVSRHENSGGFQSSVLVASDVGRFERVLRNRETLQTENSGRRVAGTHDQEEGCVGVGSLPQSTRERRGEGEGPRGGGGDDTQRPCMRGESHESRLWC